MSRLARDAFDRAAVTYDAHSVLQAEVGRRLLDHLEGLRIDPEVVLDLGCATGAGLDGLRGKFPRASLVGLDFSTAMLHRAAARTPWWRRLIGRAATPLVCADAHRLPLKSASVHLVFSNLMLQWCEPATVFAEAARVLPAGGLFMFSTFGPDTLKELRAAFAGVGAADRVNAFIDMHDLGDALVHAGFADPVMDMEYITLTYATPRAMLRELKGLGATNALAGRSRGLYGKAAFARAEAALETTRRDGRIAATFEVIYGHAWKVQGKRTREGHAIVHFDPAAGRS